MSDEGVHEIQLNGKQLVFLFMAGTVVAVVIFLCGVMVGRGVRVQQGLVTLSAEAQRDPTAPGADHDAGSPAATSDSGSAALQEDLSYPDRLSAETAPPEPLNAQIPDVSAVASDAGTAGRSDASAREPSAASTAASDRFTVQVAAVRERSEAVTIARRLTTKGYDAYVTTPAAGAPRVFRVRVGRFVERRDAEAIAGRLEKEEHFKPWITR